jgi:hypothetical protein
VLYENKLIAVYKDNLWYAALDMQRANKYKEIDGIHYC